MLGLEAYERDLCPGCGWPRTYSMHKDARGHFHGSPPIRCHGCTAKAGVEHNADPRTRDGVYYSAVPDKGMLNAMSDPVLTYEPQASRVWQGASGLYYGPQEEPT